LADEEGVEKGGVKGRSNRTNGRKGNLSARMDSEERMIARREVTER
jgi:hypothetical protein